MVWGSTLEELYFEQTARAKKNYVDNPTHDLDVQRILTVVKHEWNSNRTR